MTPDKTVSDDGNLYPLEIEELQNHVEAIPEYGHFDPDEKKTISVVIRDEDGELEHETYHQPLSAVYALVRVCREPENPEEYERESEEPPDWVQWQYCDPPLDHFADGVECSECGATTSTLQQVPHSHSGHSWDSVFHKPECPQAERDDKEYWAKRRMAAVYRNRPDPKTMALPCIWAELEELPPVRETLMPITDALGSRYERFWDVLTERLSPRFPPCSECGETALELDHDRALKCDSCYAGGFGEDTCEDYHRERRRIWGYRGHLDNGRPSEHSQSDTTEETDDG